MPHNDSDAEFLPKTAITSKLYTDEMHDYLLSLITNPHRYKNASDKFQASYNASLDGTPENVAMCEADRKELNREHTLLVGVAKVAAHQDPSLPEKLGLGDLTAKNTSGNAPLPKPDKFKVVHAKKSREMVASIGFIKNVRMVEIWGCEGDPNIEENWKLMGASPNCSGILITGLTPGTKYWFRARGLRSGEIGPWSNYVSLMAI